MVSNKSKNLEQRDDLLNLIVGGDPDNGVSGMAEYFGLGTSEGLISMLIAAAGNADGTSADKQAELVQAARDALGADDVTPFIKRYVLDVVRGASFTRDLVDMIEQRLSGEAGVTPPLLESAADAAEDLKRVLLVYGDQQTSEKYGTVSVNEFLSIESDSDINSGDPQKDKSPGLAAYIVKPVGISPSTKNVGALTLFMNTIPTHEFSRAVPYVDLTMQVGRGALSSDGRLNSPTQLKFVLGGAKVEEGTANYSIAQAANAKLDDGGELEPNEEAATAGMELFLSPQTMGPVASTGAGYAELNAPSLRPTPILDPFRPLISLDRVSIDVAASTGFMSFKTANVEMTLHDRSRMHEIADFIKPDLFSKTEFLMEYGWHHPDGIDFERSPWGSLLNAMRVKEKYGIVNSSFQFADNGEVKISLQLAMKGANEYRAVQVGQDSATQNALQRIKTLQERVAEIRSSVNNRTLGGAKHGKSVFGEQVLQAAQTTLGNPVLDPKSRRRIERVIGRLQSLEGNAKAQELADTLTELYVEGPDGKPAAVEEFQSSIQAGIKKKFQSIDGLSPTELAEGAEIITDDNEFAGGTDIRLDPFIDLSRLTVDDLKQSKTSKFVSFGKVFMKFVAEPIASSYRFDEVQVLFYPLNNGAGAARNRSVASLLIERELLKKEFETATLERRSTGMSVGEFQNFLNSNFLDNPANPSYGMATLYKPKKDNGSIKYVANFKGIRGRDKQDQWSTQIEEKLIAMGVPNGIFRPPHVDLHIEAVPARVPDGAEGRTREQQDEKTILRIHVFDKAATMYETQGELIRSISDSHLNTIGYVEPNEKDGDEGRQLASAKKIVQAADRLGILERIPDEAAAPEQADGPVTKHFRIVGGPQELKKFVMSTAPYIIYGGQNTAIEELGLQSIQDPALATVNMLRTDRAGSVTPQGSGRGGVPLKTIPARLDVSSMGCPLLSFMQQFFVDAQTGTDLDNIYAITQLSHNIDATSFKSSFEMVPQQAYGKYESTLNKVEQALGELEDYRNSLDE